MEKLRRGCGRLARREVDHTLESTRSCPSLLEMFDEYYINLLAHFWCWLRKHQPLHLRRELGISRNVGLELLSLSVHSITPFNEVTR